MNLYEINKDTQIDEFGVDHSNFSLRDEIEYNFRRAEELNNNKKINYKQLARDYANVIPMDNNDRFTQPNKYNIRDDKNYAWDLPHKYDRRPTVAGIFNNFIKISTEHPVKKAISTGNSISDYSMMQIAKKIPIVNKIILGANVANFVGGNIGNLKRAYDEAHILDNERRGSNFILSDK